MDKFTQLGLGLRKRYPRFDIAIKDDSKLMKLVAWVFWPFSPTFLQDYTTTIGYTVYMPKYLIGTQAGYEILRHEAIHVADYDRFGWLMWLSYLLCLPVALTMRSFWEFRGYAETMRVEFEETGDIQDYTIDWIEQEFVGPQYGWMLPCRPLIRYLLKKKRNEIIHGRL